MAKRARDEGIQESRQGLNDPTPSIEERFRKRLLSSPAIRTLIEKQNVEAEADEVIYEQAKDGGIGAGNVPGRCANDTSGPVLKLLLDEIVVANPKHAEWLELFVMNCESYGWNHCSCEYSEKSGSRYIERHGAVSLYSNVRHFVGYFIPRKMGKVDSAKAAAALKALIRKCIDKGLLPNNAETKSVLKYISKSTCFDGKKIVKRLNDLHDQKWWASLSSQVPVFHCVISEGEDPLLSLEQHLHQRTHARTHARTRLRAHARALACAQTRRVHPSH